MAKRVMIIGAGPSIERSMAYLEKAAELNSEVLFIGKDNLLKDEKEQLAPMVKGDPFHSPIELEITSISDGYRYTVDAPIKSHKRPYKYHR